MSPWKRLLVLVLIAGPLAACEVANPEKPLPQLTFNHLSPINLAVERVEVANQYGAPLRLPNVEHRFETTPAQALTNWASARLKAVGGPGIARFVIQDASAMQEELKLSEGLAATFKTEQALRYTLTMAATLEITGGGTSGQAATRVTESKTTPENATINDLRKEWFALTEKGAASFDREMEKNVRQFLGGFIR